MNCGPWIWAAAFSILPRFGLPANTTRVYTKPKKVSIFFNRGGEQYTLLFVFANSCHLAATITHTRGVRLNLYSNKFPLL